MHRYIPIVLPDDFYVGGRYDEYVKLLLHLDNNFTDNAVYGAGHNFSANGSLFSTSQKKFGTHSLYADGSNDYSSCDSSSDFQFGSSTDFTVDFWFYRVGAGGSYSRLLHFGPTQTYAVNSWALIDSANGETTGTIAFQAYNIAEYSMIVTGTTVLADSTWYHIAFTRLGNVYKLYINGIVDISYTDTGSNSLDDGPQLVCIQGTSESAVCCGNSYIDEIRISKGIARWTSNFTPPTSAY